MEVTGSNPVEALIFFGLLLSNCLNWKIYCDDHSSLSHRHTISFICRLKCIPKWIAIWKANLEAGYAARGKKFI